VRHYPLPVRRIVLNSILFSLGLTGMPVVQAASLADCAALGDNAARLACYDEMAMDVAKASAASAADPETESPQKPIAEESPKAAEIQVSRLSKRWELDPASKRGMWRFQDHKPSYFLFGRYTDSVNTRPYDVFFNAVGDPNLGIDDTEAKFQFSFKLKALEGMFGSDADLWLGYTQQNQWQVYNKSISAPFRETNYEPEVFVTLPTRFDLLGLNGRFINLGFVHQSNGQSNILSRSWNRIYAQVGFEHGDDFSLLFKPWYRIKEKASDDDNPNITDYLGDFEAVASYRMGKYTLSALGRSTFDFDRGYLQLDWTFPLHENLKGYVQFSTGYGESLIDYDHDQNTLGIGIMLTDWM
jgi:phospholipase A1/A2